MGFAVACVLCNKKKAEKNAPVDWDVQFLLHNEPSKVQELPIEQNPEGCAWDLCLERWKAVQSYYMVFR